MQILKPGSLTKKIMKVLLLNHVQGLGKKGEIKDVSEGHFRNMLAPRKLAVVATGNAVQHVQNQKAKATEKLEKMEESALSIKERLDGKILELKEKASESGKLYAAVSSKELAEEFKKQLKVEVPMKNIQMTDSIKEAGNFSVQVKLYKGITANITIHVTAE